jgi:hypothetical protein
MIMLRSAFLLDFHARLRSADGILTRNKASLSFRIFLIVILPGGKVWRVQLALAFLDLS